MAQSLFGLTFDGAAQSPPPQGNDPEVDRILRAAQQRNVDPPAPVLEDPYAGKGFGGQLLQELKDELTGGAVTRQRRYQAAVDARRDAIARRAADSQEQEDRIKAAQYGQQQDALKEYTAMAENPNLPASTRIWAAAQRAGLKTDNLGRQDFSTEADVVQQGRREGLTGLVSADIKARGDVGQGTGQPSDLPVIGGLQPTRSSRPLDVSFGSPAPKPMTPMTPTPMPGAGPAGPSSFSMTSPTPVGSIGLNSLKIGADDLAGRPGVAFKTDQEIRQSRGSYHAPAPEPVYRIQTVDENGNPVTRFVTRSEAAGHDDMAVGPTADMRARQNAALKVIPTLTTLQELSKRINVNKGLMATASGFASRAAAKANYDDDVAEYTRLVKSHAPLIARAMGHTGVLTQVDVDSAIAMVPQPEDSESLAKRLLDRMISNLNETLKAGQVSPVGGGQSGPAAPNAATGTAQPKAAFSFATPNGKVIPFATQAELDAFKALVKAQGGGGQ